ncbi:hypothetical protein H2200_010835 [Cladophialophora chaetospira]|uniref:Peptidase S54 rhomboid domain-containing protein n=1 Tax=Cladophialophora chaetospira TaxID=386627 RepID=A0AA38X0V5_9EURO|nr:hypothetical protein H2200_010835 [Cladophialophora chaetospira]
MDAILLECSIWSQLSNRARERVQRTFATYRDLPKSRDALRGVHTELLRRLYGDPAARGIMWFSSASKGIASSVGVFVAWNWSLGALPHQRDSKGRAQARTAQQVSLFEKLSNNFTIKLEDVQKHRWWTLITPAFSHLELSHIFGNLMAFYTFSTMAIRGGLPALGYGMLLLGSAVSGHLGFYIKKLGGTESKCDDSTSQAQVRYKRSDKLKRSGYQVQ